MMDRKFVMIIVDSQENECDIIVDDTLRVKCVPVGKTLHGVNWYGLRPTHVIYKKRHRNQPNYWFEKCIAYFVGFSKGKLIEIGE